MFENILIPISSEYYSKDVLSRSVFLAEKFNSKIHLVYIIEEKTLKQTGKLSESYRTQYDIDETKKQIIIEQRKTADNIIFDEAKKYLNEKNITFNEKIEEGEFSSVIKHETERKKYDLILMSFAKECVLNYRLLDEIKIPVWVETGDQHKTILAVCSNLSPNQIVPNISIELSKRLGWNLQFLYVVDMEDSVKVDEKGKRLERQPPKNLISAAHKFSENIKQKGYPINIVTGGIEREIVKEASKIQNPLIIVGRGQKKKTIFGLPIKKFKKRLAEKCDHSILFIN